MINNEIKIILDPSASNKEQGNVLERLVKQILDVHQYDVKENIHFTGLEIDLLAKHRYRQETLYVECKAKEKVTSDEIKKFMFNILYKKPDYGYFIRTKEIEQQAGALIEEFSSNPEYRNVSFLEPYNVIKILVEAKVINEPKSQISNVTKRILCLSIFGDYFIYIINHASILPTNILIVNAQNGEDLLDESIISVLKEKIDEIKDLKQIYIESARPDTLEISGSINSEIENLSEVQSSEKWNDYLPASSKHFVGRDLLRAQFFDFFKEISTGNSSKRIFYLTGKSGWGKSSLVVEVRDRCRNKHYKNKFFALAIDSRSATSNNFVALSFQKMIKAAIRTNFIKPSLFNTQIEFVSNNDLFKSSSVQDLLLVLKNQNKYLILIFDQFEDVFRKVGLFKSFYKFLSDVTDLQGNIVVGFSWKTEILIPSDNEAYHYWQQAKEQAYHFSIPEFGSKEISGVIKQLQRSTGKIKEDLQRRIKESSQGLPWLTKKLCIHIYDQLQLGISQERLIDENLNIEGLFKSDIENLNSLEYKTLEYIARRANDGNFFEVSEIGDKIQEGEIDALRDKRLVIRSGAYYNIYWDIFRDYLVTKQVPQIGEAFILRYGPKVCSTVYQLFKSKQKTYSLEELQNMHPKNSNKRTLENILIDLRYLGLIKKIENSETYVLASSDMDASENFFKSYLKDKFKNYTPYIKLLRQDKKAITFEDCGDILRDTFRGNNFKSKTWAIYTTVILSWFKFADLEISKKIVVRSRGGVNLENSKDFFYFTRTPDELLTSMQIVNANSGKFPSKVKRDLYALGLVDQELQFTKEAEEILKLQDVVNKRTKILELGRSYPKVSVLEKIIEQNARMSAKKLLKLLPADFFGKMKESSKLVYLGILRSWTTVYPTSYAKVNMDEVFLLSSPKGCVKGLRDFGKGLRIDKHVQRDLKLMGLLDKTGVTALGSSLTKFDDASLIISLKQIVLQFPKVSFIQKVIEDVRSNKSSIIMPKLPNNFFQSLSIKSRQQYLHRLISWAE